jgi:hypothetical protein
MRKDSIQLRIKKKIRNLKEFRIDEIKGNKRTSTLQESNGR